MPRISNYDKKIEAFRSYYLMNTGKNLDDELLHIIIKISEAHADLKKDIRANKPAFYSVWDYFVFGLGSIVTASILATLFILLFLILHQ